MASPFDLIIRGGLVADGSGREPFVGDVAVSGGRIAAIGEIDGTAAEEIDARGLLVTPGFVDVHTHYDGQAIWSERMAPSSSHGVTTVVVGNCGVGFAPCRPAARELLISAMEGVEDIPGVVMTEGLTWEWETFPEFLDALEKRRHDIDIAAYIPHSPLRVYVMGERGANREPATAEDIEQMVALTRTAMAAGAVGFATSRITFHRRIDGEFIPSYKAAELELHAIAQEVGRWGGIFQVVSELTEGDDDDGKARADFEFLQAISKAGNVPVTFTIGQTDVAPHRLAEIMDWVAAANEEDGVCLRPQLFPRPVGLLVGFDLSANPFMERPTYRAIAGLPLDERVAQLRTPEIRQAILSETSGKSALPLMAMARKFERMYPMGQTPNYEPDPDASVSATAQRMGITPDELAYDLLLERDGHAMLMVALANYAEGSLEPLRAQLVKPDTVLGLGDGGAHYGLICDATYPTFMLSHWARDRKRGLLSIADTVRALSAKPAILMGFSDRGELAVGRKADINLIDMSSLGLHAPTVERDLPGGGRRLSQTATGFHSTFVNGRVIQRDGVATGELPGRLIRSQNAPANQPDGVAA